MRVAFLKKAKPLKECFKILRTLTPDNALRVAKVLCTFLLKNDPKGNFRKHKPIGAREKANLSTASLREGGGFCVAKAGRSRRWL